MELQNVTGPDVMRTSFSVTPQQQKEEQQTVEKTEVQKVENEQKGFSVDTYA